MSVTASRGAAATGITARPASEVIAVTLKISVVGGTWKTQRLWEEGKGVGMVVDIWMLPLIPGLMAS